ncbi:fibronectin type III domain-containing protein [Nonomuraea fuscirosea]|uniref:fibronectin type III domain-containing protein n=1 Tax=Nonomuraea fuscirosea TaxID=1291556 RepID=UPI003711287D
MIVRGPVYYTTTTERTTHTLSFGGAVAAGRRIVLVVNSYATPTNMTGDYELHELTTHTFGMRLYSKISEGDSSVTLTTNSATNRIAIWMYELSNAERFYGSQSGLTSGTATFGLDNLPDGCSAIAGVSTYVTFASEDNSGVSWPSGWSHEGYLVREWTDGTFRRVWSANATREVDGSVSFSQQLVTGLPSATPNYAWSAGVWGPEPDTTPPEAPPNLRLTAMTPTSVSIAWDAASDNQSGIAGYGIYRNGVKEGGDQSGRTRTFNGLTSGVAYMLEVDAVDGSGNRSAKSLLTVTPINDTTPPDTPVVKVTALGAGSITAAWDEPFDQTAITAYGVYLNGVKQGQDQAGRTRSFTGLTPGGLYTVGVDAKDLLGNRSAIGTKTVRAEPDVTPPTVPGNVRLLSVSQTAVTITWDASSDDNVGVAGYGLYRGNILVATVPSQVFTFTGLTPSITYPLGVDAVDELGNRSARMNVTATTLEDSSGTTPPYEFVFFDAESHLPIDSLPLQRPSFSIEQFGGGQMTAEIPLYDETYSVGRVTAATRTERTILVVYRGERNVWTGRVIDPTDYDSESGILRISGEEVVGIFNRRFVAFTGPRTATTPHTEMNWLLEQASQPADTRWLRTGGVAGSGTADREYRKEDFARVLDTAAEVAAAPGGFDWWCAPSWDNVNDRPQVELRRVSRDDPPVSDLVLEYPGNVRSFRRSTRRGLATVAHGKLSISSGGVLLARRESTDLHVLGWPLTEDAHQFEGLTSQEALQAETDRAAEASRGAKQVFEFELIPGPDVRWWEWELGSLARVVITDFLYPERPDGSAGLDREMKIVSKRVEPTGDGGERVTITTAELTAAVDEDEYGDNT